VVQGEDPANPSFFPSLRVLHQLEAGTLKEVESPAELLDLIAPAVASAPPAALARLADELTDCLLNDALCCTYRTAWSARLRRSADAAREADFWTAIKSRSAGQGQIRLLEQWGAVGHPYHPTHKTRIGMSPAEVMHYCPEFETRVQVGLVAARRARVHGETMPGAAEWQDWLETWFPAEGEAWRRTVIDGGHDPADFIALPVHPWQRQHVLPRRFSRSIAKGDLLLLDGPGIACAPLVSVRTLMPLQAPDAPHLKISLGVRLTSVERTISPRSCEMGPRISDLLQRVVARDDKLSPIIRIQPEIAGMYFASQDPDELADARFLSALLRGNPSSLCAADDILIPGTALTALSPMTGAPLFVDFAETLDGAGAEKVLARFADYSDKFLRALLTLYLRYGIGVEAHQQNTLVHYSGAGALKGFVLRDFGGIRIHEESLRKAGFQLKVHPDRLTVTDDRNVARQKFVSRALIRHLDFLISRICQHLQIAEKSYWAAVADLMAAAFDDLRGDVDAATWAEDRRALLDEDWDLKANLRMRFENVSGDVYLKSPNPLRQDGSPIFR
jgi:siderophore synthetase component